MVQCEKVCVALAVGLLTDSGVFAFSSKSNKEPSLSRNRGRVSREACLFGVWFLPHTLAVEVCCCLFGFVALRFSFSIYKMGGPFI